MPCHGYPEWLPRCADGLLSYPFETVHSTYVSDGPVPFESGVEILFKPDRSHLNKLIPMIIPMIMIVMIVMITIAFVVVTLIKQH